MDKYKAVWVSHSSISDYLACPRAYYLRNVYKDPLTGHKITITAPALSLGQVVHEVLESLSTLPAPERLKTNLLKRFDETWNKVTGVKGGFKNANQEKDYKDRGEAMIKTVTNNPRFLEKKAVKIKSDINLPNYPFSIEDNIILCGKIDWLTYNEKNNSVHIVDFKTGKNEESESSLQLPIYSLLVKNTQKRKVNGASYWYLETDKVVEKDLPNEKEAFEKVYEVAKRISLARKLGHFVCPKGGCIKCLPLERVLRGEATKVGISDTRQDIYVLN